MRNMKNMIQSKVLSSLIIVFGTFFVNASVLAADLKLTNPLGENDPKKILGQLVASVLGFVGSLALVMFIYGGLTWMLSGGSPDKVKKGRDIFVWATLGLVVIFSSYMIVDFVFKLFE